MIEHNVLIGNGINIEFSGNDDYKNFKIIERVMQNLETRRYDDVFANSIEPNELKGFLTSLNEIFKDMLVGLEYIRYTDGEDELISLLEMSKRYKDKLNGVLDVGMEDYFFAIKILFNKLGDDETPLSALNLGTSYLFLDSIYNEGKIQELYLKMDCYKKELQSYNNIFTINYDTNLDKLVEKEVYHLHGSFDVLQDQYRDDTLLGYINQRKIKPNKVIDSMRHIYCNAIMSYSGELKLEQIELPSKCNDSLDYWRYRINNPSDIEAQEQYLRLNNSQINDDTKKQIEVSLKFPELKYSEYPIKNFREISGILSIIGMSPNNDSHIFRLINDNPNIKKVIYYYASLEDSVNIKKVINKKVETRNIFKYWKKFKNKNQ